jgi:hypothetical protein
MLSSLGSFSGLSAANLLTLLGANSSSSSPSSTSTSAAQSAPTGASPSSANDPANAIKAILAQAQIGQAQAGTSGGGWTISAAAEAYAQMGGSSSLVSANVTISSPGAAKQIADAVTEINNAQVLAQNGNVASPVTVSASDAINITINDGAVTATTMGAAFPDGLPSPTSIMQAYNWIVPADQWEGIDTAYNGSFTLIKLPPNTGGSSPNFTVFSADGWGSDNNKWALVLTRDTIQVSMSDIQAKD